MSRRDLNQAVLTRIQAAPRRRYPRRRVRLPLESSHHRDPCGVGHHRANSARYPLTLAETDLGRCQTPCPAGTCQDGAESVDLLIVDQDLSWPRQVRNLLDKCGAWLLRRAPSALAGMNELRRRVPSCLLLTADLADVKGLCLLEQIRQDPALRFVPVILLSKAPDDKVASAAMKAGAQDYLVKEGLTSEALARAVFHAVRRLEQERRLHEQRQRLRWQNVELKQLHERSRLLVEQNADAIVILDQDRVIRYVNPAAEALFYKGRGELEGSRFPHDLGPGQAEITIQRRSDQATAELRAVATTWDGEPALLVTLRDVTARRQAEAERERLTLQLQHSQRLEGLGVLASGIAHDFNNLLTAVVGNADLLHKSSGSAEFTQRADRIKQLCERAAGVVRQMLTYAGKQRLQRQTCDLNTLAGTTIQLLETALPRRIELRLAPGLPEVAVDPIQIQQVIVNLVTNGAEALEGRTGIVRLKTYLADDPPQEHDVHVLVSGDPSDHPSVVLEVQDEGCGIPPEQLGKICDPFYTSKFDGRGLGLSVVLGIVRGHGGSLVCQSQPGVGTIFRAYLPAIPAPPEASLDGPPSDPALSPLPLQDRHVFVVDDDDDVQEVVARILTEAGARVRQASNGAQLVERLGSGELPPEAILLDLTMPVMDGAETLRQLRARGSEVPVVMASGHVQVERMAELAELGMTSFLPKPFDEEALLAALTGVLAG